MPKAVIPCGIPVKGGFRSFRTLGTGFGAGRFRVGVSTWTHHWLLLQSPGHAFLKWRAEGVMASTGGRFTGPTRFPNGLAACPAREEF